MVGQDLGGWGRPTLTLNHDRVPLARRGVAGAVGAWWRVGVAAAMQVVSLCTRSGRGQAEPATRSQGGQPPLAATPAGGARLRDCARPGGASPGQPRNKRLGWGPAWRGQTLVPRTLARPGLPVRAPTVPVAGPLGSQGHPYWKAPSAKGKKDVGGGKLSEDGGVQPVPLAEILSCCRWLNPKPKARGWRQ